MPDVKSRMRKSKVEVAQENPLFNKAADGVEVEMITCSPCTRMIPDSRPGTTPSG
jgi:hypothetical protein